METLRNSRAAALHRRLRLVPKLYARTLVRSVASAIALVLLVGACVSPVASAQTSVVGASTSTSSTTEGARKSFFDPAGLHHWVFWYNGTGIEYASSPDGSTFTSRGTLPYNTPHFSVAFQVIGGTSYLFLVTEANTYDVVMRRGTISGTSITFESEVTVLNGTSASDAYVRPAVVCDGNNKVWTAAIKDLGPVGDRYQFTARRTTGSGAHALAFDSATSVGKPSITLTRIAMAPITGDKLLAVVSGESGKNVVSYQFNGSAWGVVRAGDSFGSSEFAWARADSTIWASAVDAHGNLYVAGNFTKVGNTAANRIAKWDGTTWSSLGEGLNGQVFTDLLAFAPNGHLYVAGDFTTAGGIPANHIARWDGSSWSGLGIGLPNNPESLVISSSGVVYVGGGFTTAGGIPANRIAMWDGSSWSALGAGMNMNVRSLALDSNGILYAAGGFTTAGGVAASGFARWDGSSWSAVGSGSHTGIYSMVFDTNGTLYAGGSFATIGGVSASNIAKWDGISWSALGSGVNSSVYDLALDGSGNLYAGGAFTTAGGVAAKWVAKWSGASWTAVGDSPVSPYNLTSDTSGVIYAFGSQGSMAKWDGTVWSSIGGGLDNFIWALAADSVGNIYAGGDFIFAGGATVNRIAKWNGSIWSPLGSGMNSSVYALAVDGNNHLYAGGDFTTAGGVAANRIAKWDGTSWSPLGSGMSGTVGALSLDSAGNLYAGGNFTNAGGVTSNNIAIWNGTSWSNLGSGVDAFVDVIVFDSSNNLYAGGYFANAGGSSASGIAKWDGSAWSALGTGVNGHVTGLAINANGNVYAAGYFSTAGGVAASNIARWDGTSWSPLGAGINGYGALDLTIDASGNIYAGGYFTEAGGSAANKLAWWNGSAWSAIPYGSDEVDALVLDSAGNLFAGGTSLVMSNPVQVNNQLAGTNASLVSGTGGTAHLVYLDENSDVILKTYTESTSSWSAATPIHSGAVSSQVAGMFGPTSTLGSWFIEGGSVKYSEASAPYTTWSAPTTVSSSGSPREVSVAAHSGTHSQLVATWNRIGGSPGEVAASVGGPLPTPTPTATMTFTVTPTRTATATPTKVPVEIATQTPTPIATQVPATSPLPTPPPPDIEFGQPGERPSGPKVVVDGQDIVVSGKGPAGQTVEIKVDGIVVGTVVIGGSGNASTESWSFTLPPLAPGTREITTTYISTSGVRSAPSAPVTIVVLAAAPLDFTGTGDTAIASWRRAGRDIRFKIRRASGSQWITRTVRGHYPAVADYDDDGVSDIAAVEPHKGRLSWNVTLSSTGAGMTTSLGENGDTIVSGCNLVANKGASFAVFKSRQRALEYRSVGDTAVKSVSLKGLGSCNIVGCGDTDGDGVDEVLFSIRGTDNRVRLVGYDTRGRRTFESKYNQFVRGFVVDRPDSPVPLVAVMTGTEDRGRQMRITTMAGSFAFPRFFVDRDATIGTGTFLTDSNQQTPGIFWASRSTRRVYRRFLASGATSTELFTLPKGYSLVRAQGIVRTEAGG